MRSARTSRYSRSTGTPVTTPSAPKSCTAASTTRCASRGPEQVQRGQGDLEAVAFAAEQMLGRDAAAVQPQRAERVRGADGDALGDAQAGRVGVQHEGAQAGGAARRGAGEEHVL